MKLKIGTKVRFLRNNLGASERDDLSRFVEEKFGTGDVGVVAFPHPRAADKKHPMRKEIRAIAYVEVESKAQPGHKLYVPEHEDHLDVVR